MLIHINHSFFYCTLVLWQIVVLCGCFSAKVSPYISCDNAMPPLPTFIHLYILQEQKTKVQIEYPRINIKTDSQVLDIGSNYFYLLIFNNI